MTRLRVTLALVLVMVAVLLAAGCAGEVGDGKSAGNVTLPVVTNNDEIIFTQTNTVVSKELQCPQMENNSVILIYGYPFMYNGSVPRTGISTVRVWIFVEKRHGTWSGKSQSWTYRNTYDYMIMSVPVQSDTFNFSFTANQTKEMGGGKYRLIFQYPTTGNSFDIRTQIDQNREEVYDKQGGLLINLRNIRQQKMRSFDAADILEQGIKKFGSGDTSSNFSFDIQIPVIRVNPVGDHHMGDIFFINGTTNLPAGEELDFGISICCPRLPHNVFLPKYCDSTVIVQQEPCGDNTWSILVNSSELYPNRLGEYWVVRADNRDLIASGSTSFNISAVPYQTPAVIQSPNVTMNNPVTTP